ncbi:hypothetical protein [Nocardia nova]|nr:hypothetical protein [Nocardia nova]
MGEQYSENEASPMPASREFGAFKFAGGRYDTVGLPVHAMSELQRYAKLVGMVAHALYLEQNTDRRRVPQGFSEALDLRLTAIHPGSVQTVLEWTGFDTADQPIVDAHEDARALVDRTFEELAHSGQLPKEFPPKALGVLGQFGRSLRDDERIELGTYRDQRAVVNTHIRERLAAVANFETIDVERVLIGRITGIESLPRHSFTLVLAGPDAKRLDCGFADPETFTAIEEFVGYARDAPLCALTVLAEQRTSGELTVTDVLAVETALPPDWVARVAALSEIRDGWLNPETPRPTVESIDVLELLLARCVEHNIPRPLMYPSAEGGVQLEWRREASGLEIEIYNARTVDASWFALDSERSEDASFMFTDIDQIVEFIVGNLHD